MTIGFQMRGQREPWELPLRQDIDLPQLPGTARQGTVHISWTFHSADKRKEADNNLKVE